MALGTWVVPVRVKVRDDRDEKKMYRVLGKVSAAENYRALYSKMKVGILVGLQLPS